MKDREGARLTRAALAEIAAADRGGHRVECLQQLVEQDSDKAMRRRTFDAAGHVDALVARARRPELTVPHQPSRHSRYNTRRRWEDRRVGQECDSTCRYRW